VNQLTYFWSGAHALPKHDETASILVAIDKIYSTLLTNDPESPVPDTAIIMIDGIHILSLDVELLLGMLHMVLQKRPDLRLVLASATCEADRLVKHFSQFSPVKIEITGTAHHIEHIYLQPDDRRSQETRILQGLRSFFLDPLILNGDCMVFMKNLKELAPVMWSCARTLRRDHPAVFDNVEFLVLSADDAREYEDPSTSRPTEDGSGNMMRKVIFATSVAASSITLPNVRLVMITGKIEEPHFDHRTRSTEMVTRSLALTEIIQMSGRTGRTRPGTVMHFYHCNDSDKLA
jgi:ATP-dependent helicase HrpA